MRFFLSSSDSPFDIIARMLRFLRLSLLPCSPLPNELKEPKDERDPCDQAADEPVD